ncbi:MAG: exosortase system-associated protein, TIGR04073 family [Candidatus Omnitrophica bacterium]|nr:exosortase system-associated protein, TIGR04073 family [Candidatus Omnitrophota bacterium]MDD5654883.1 exosortase system-associated protein, TIGR04073 family [Candidatus Omnitrophota bacterium]
MDKNKIVSRTVVSFLVLSVIALAFYSTGTYAGDPIRKLGRGVANIATGWAEIPAEIFRESDREGDVAGMFAAPFKGIAKAIGRTAVGAYEIVTFIIPLPRFYEPVIEPEFIF